MLCRGVSFFMEQAFRFHSIIVVSLTSTVCSMCIKTSSSTSFSCSGKEQYFITLMSIPTTTSSFKSLQKGKMMTIVSRIVHSHSTAWPSFLKGRMEDEVFAESCNLGTRVRRNDVHRCSLAGNQIILTIQSIQSIHKSGFKLFCSQTLHRIGQRSFNSAIPNG